MGIDAELLLENLQRAVAWTVQLGNQQIVVEDEALPTVAVASGSSGPISILGTGLVLGQKAAPRSCLCSLLPAGG
jgi:hypothetical protein